MNILRTIQKTRESAVGPEGLRALLILYWQLSFTAVCLLMCGALIFGGWQLYVVMTYQPEEQSAQQAEVSQPLPINVADIEVILGSFNKRRARFEGGGGLLSELADPMKS